MLSLLQFFFENVKLFLKVGNISSKSWDIFCCKPSRFSCNSFIFFADFVAVADLEVGAGVFCDIAGCDDARHNMQNIKRTFLIGY